MRRRHRPVSFAALLAITLASLGFASHCNDALARDDVTIYRCTDARGHLTLQDSPCAKGDTQRTQQMIRPVDPPPKPAPPPGTALTPITAAAAPEASRTIVIRPAQPMYECVRDDNTTYTSDSGEGNPRWIADYGYGYPLLIGGVQQGTYRHGFHQRGRHRGDGGPGPDPVVTRTPVNPPGTPSAGATTRPRVVGIANQHGPSSTPPMSRPYPPTSVSGNDAYDDGDNDRYGYGYGYAGGGGYWARDACRPLPQDDVCALARNRLDALRRRFFNAQPTEREQLSKEERGITARLSADCGSN